MTISTINTPVTGYETNRLEHLESSRPDTQKSKAAQTTGSDRISISGEGRLKASMFNAAQADEGIRTDKVAEIKARISSGAYAVDSQDIATKMVQQELDIWG